MFTSVCATSSVIPAEHSEESEEHAFIHGRPSECAIDGMLASDVRDVIRNTLEGELQNWGNQMKGTIKDLTSTLEEWRDLTHSVFGSPQHPSGGSKTPNESFSPSLHNLTSSTGSEGEGQEQAANLKMFGSAASEDWRIFLSEDEEKTHEWMLRNWKSYAAVEYAAPREPGELTIIGTPVHGRRRKSWEEKHLLSPSARHGQSSSPLKKVMSGLLFRRGASNEMQGDSTEASPSSQQTEAPPETKQALSSSQTASSIDHLLEPKQVDEIASSCHTSQHKMKSARSAKSDGDLSISTGSIGTTSIITGTSTARRTVNAAKSWAEQHSSFFSRSSRITAVPPPIVTQLSSARTGIRYRVKIFISNQYFDLLIGALIVLNSLLIAIQAEYSALDSRSEAEVPDLLYRLSTIFCVFFGIELALRLYVSGCRFFTEVEWRWNIFDFSVVVLQVAEEVMSAADASIEDNPGSSATFMRVLRVARLVRIIRLVRVLRCVRELRTLIGAVVGTMRSLLWTVTLLLVTMFVVGVYLTQVTADHGREHPESVLPGSDFYQYFGSIGRSMMSLYQAMSGGINWGVLLDPLMNRLHPTISIVFCAYIAFVVFAMLNVITGVFVESALQNSKEDTDIDMAIRLREVFSDSDLQLDDGQVKWEQFLLQINKMEHYFKSLDLDVSEAESLFHLLDVQQRGSIDVEDFIMGCLRLRGPAKAIDLATLMSETRRLSLQHQRHTKRLEALLRRRLHATTEVANNIASMDEASQRKGQKAMFSRTVPTPKLVSEATSFGEATPQPPDPPKGNFSHLLVEGIGKLGRLRSTSEATSQEMQKTYI